MEFSDAPRVGTVLEQAGISFDRVLCSDARRARQTLLLISQGVAIDEDVIEFRSDMYGASAHHLLSCLAEQADTVRTLHWSVIIPVWKTLPIALAGEVVGAMSTCNVVRIGLDCESWSDLYGLSGNVSLIIRPRDL